MVSAKLYVEGGGDSKMIKTACRRGYQKFIERAGATGNMPRIVACGSRENAYNSFSTACAEEGSAMLLVDSEEPVTAPGPWEHLKGRDNWDRPTSATDDQCHLMVQAMESWFLADMAALVSYYGQGFRRQVFPQNPNIEDVSKPDVNNSLDQATRDTQKGRYNKGKHSFEILEKLDPAKIRGASHYADRFLETLLGS